MVRPAASPRTQSPPQRTPVAKPATPAKPAVPKQAPAKPATERRDAANPAPLAGPGGMVARREFQNAPLRGKDAITAYGKLTANDLAGADDIRLRQINQAATRENVALTRRLSASAAANGVDDAMIYGRAKDPFSLFGKLLEAPGTTIDSVKDLSGARIDIKPNQPGFSQYYRAQDAARETFGDAMKLKQDYIQNPNRWGYTGRIHHHIEGANGLTHELQIGSRDLSQFIDKKLTTSGGDKIKLHDATGYKGKIYGVDLPEGMQREYTGLMGKIADANRAGKAVDDVPALRTQLDDFYRRAEAGLPAKLNAPPAPELSTRAELGNAASKGMGALGVVGGGFQAANGVQELRDGKLVEGGANVTAGAGSMVSGAALMTGRVALGTTTGGAVAVVDGAKDIYVGIRDGNVEKAATGGVKTAAGGAMIAGVATANPVLIAGGAIAYGGAVVYENRQAIADGARRAWGWVKSWF